MVETLTEEYNSLSPAEQEEIQKVFAPTAEEKHNVHTFLHQVATDPNTTRTANLDTTELGVTRFSLRSYGELALASKELCNDNIWQEYFKKKGEILSGTSLSKNGFLDQLAVVQRREIGDITPRPQKPNSGWFKKKTSEGGNT